MKRTLVLTLSIVSSFSGSCRTVQTEADTSEIEAGFFEFERDFAGHEFNFCPNYKAYDQTNAFWMSLYAGFAYAKFPDIAKILSAEQGHNIRVNDKFNVTALGFDKFEFFSSEVPKHDTPMHYPPESPEGRHLVRRWEGRSPLPLSICYDENLQTECLIRAGPTGLQILKGPQNKKACQAPYPAGRLQTRKDLRGLISQLKAGNYRELTQILLHGTGWSVEDLIYAYDVEKRDCAMYSLDDSQYFADTQIIYAEKGDSIFVAFRGTQLPEESETFKWKEFLGSERDVRTNLEVSQEHFLDYALKYFDPTLEQVENRDVKIHSGFISADVIAFGWLQKKLQAAIASGRKKTVFLSGHSLGGALATIAYFSMMYAKTVKIGRAEPYPLELGGLYTYGSPRVGNHEFMKMFHDLAQSPNVDSSAFRHVYEEDIVALIPYLKYYHVGNLHYHYGGKWRRNPQFIDFQNMDNSSQPDLSTRAQQEAFNTQLETLYKFPYFKGLWHLVFDREKIDIRIEDHNIKKNYVYSLQNSISDNSVKNGKLVRRSCDDRLKLSPDNKDFPNEYLIRQGGSLRIK